MSRLRAMYGAPLSHLAAVLIGAAISIYGITRVTDLTILTNIAIWFLGMLLVHDLVLFPVYGTLDNLLTRVRGRTPPRVPWINHVRVPVVLAGLLFLAWYPLILRLSRGYPRATHRSDHVFLGRWLMVTGALFAVSAILYAVRRTRSRAVAVPELSDQTSKET